MVLFTVNVTLNRRQRLGPHLREWGGVGVLIVLFHGMWLLRLPEAFLKSFTGGVFWFLLGLVTLLATRRFYLGFAQAIRFPVLRYSVDFLEDCLGVHSERILGDDVLVVWMKGLNKCFLTSGVWNMAFFNGTVIRVPDDVLTTEQREWFEKRAASIEPPAPGQKHLWWYWPAHFAVALLFSFGIIAFMLIKAGKWDGPDGVAPAYLLIAEIFAGLWLLGTATAFLCSRRGRSRSV